MNIAIDMMGGDYAPKATIAGAILARKELPADVNLLLVGREDEINAGLKELGANPSDYTIVHASEVVGMGEHPTKAITQKPDSSIAKGFALLAAGEAEAFASAGNSGAMLVGAMYSVRTIEGISRPAISTPVPKEKGNYGIMLDVGANADCKPETLLQFAILGSIYAKNVLKIDNPKVGLMNLGEEAEKGSILTQAAHKLLAERTDINFVGNLEGRDLFNDKADVIVCDGFTGNVILKLAESFYYYLRKYKVSNEFFDKFNYENYGGSPILGVNRPVIIGHGISNDLAIKNMILQAYQIRKARLSDRIKESLLQH